MADEAPGARWRVEDMIQTTRVTPAGRFEDVYEITVGTSYGGTFKITVPVSAYTPGAVKTQIEAEYLLHEQTRFLHG